MARPARSEPSSRLNLELPTSLREKLEKLRESTKADSLSEVIRRAIEIHFKIRRELDKGNSLIIRENGKDKFIEFF